MEIEKIKELIKDYLATMPVQPSNADVEWLIFKLTQYSIKLESLTRTRRYSSRLAIYDLMDDLDSIRYKETGVNKVERREIDQAALIHGMIYTDYQFNYLITKNIPKYTKIRRRTLDVVDTTRLSRDLSASKFRTQVACVYRLLDDGICEDLVYNVAPNLNYTITRATHVLSKLDMSWATYLLSNIPDAVTIHYTVLKHLYGEECAQKLSSTVRDHRAVSPNGILGTSYSITYVSAILEATYLTNRNLDAMTKPLSYAIDGQYYIKHNCLASMALLYLKDPDTLSTYMSLGLELTKLRDILIEQVLEFKDELIETYKDKLLLMDISGMYSSIESTKQRIECKENNTK